MEIGGLKKKKKTKQNFGLGGSKFIAISPVINGSEYFKFHFRKM